jgi:peptide alpha-N-acetyltransferase
MNTNDINEIIYVDYKDESLLPEIQILVAHDLSEPYSIFTYRYFLHNWPELCICAFVRPKGSNERGTMVATIVCKAEDESGGKSGYIAMLTVDNSQRKKGIGIKVN